MKRILLLCLFTLFIVGACTNKKQPKEKREVRILNYNVRNGKGMDDLTNYERTAEVIKSLNPNVVAIQELDSVTNRSNGVDVLLELSKLTDMYAVYGSAIDYDGGKYGIGVLSKEKPISWKKTALPGREELRTALIVEFTDYVFCCTHWSLTEEDRLASIDLINAEIEKYIDKTIFLSGDLNAHPESEEIASFREKWTVLTDPTIFTFPADQPNETLDYIAIYSKSGIDHTVVKKEVVNEPMASDHRPVLVDVEF